MSTSIIVALPFSAGKRKTDRSFNQKAVKYNRNSRREKTMNEEKEIKEEEKVTKEKEAKKEEKTEEIIEPRGEKEITIEQDQDFGFLIAYIPFRTKLFR